MSHDTETDAETDTACAVALGVASDDGSGPVARVAHTMAAARRVASRAARRRLRRAACRGCVRKRRREGSSTVGARASARIDPARALANATEQGIAVHLLGEPGYPVELSGDHEAPSVCFVLGDASKLSSPVRVAVIGTRSATAPGLAMAKRLGHDLAEAGVSVVSGLARGIDGAAHLGALHANGAPPIGVVGSGLDVPYPKVNAGLWSAVAAQGVLLSEAPPGAPPSAWRFPARNRMIAALADVVVVIESRAAGGSMLTVREAAARGRQVMAVPGSVASPASEGTNQLIYDGCCPVRDALDVLIALGLSSAERGRAGARRRRPQR